MNNGRIPFSSLIFSVVDGTGSVMYNGPRASFSVTVLKGTYSYILTSVVFLARGL